MVQLTVAEIRFFLLVLSCTAATYARTPILGYTQNPPLTYQESGGAPAGFVVDVLNAAAKRQGVPVQWRLVPPGAAMDTVDVWPAGAATENRRRSFYITNPWWSSGLLLLSRDFSQDSGRSAAALRIVTTGDLLAVAGQKLGNVRLERTPSHAEGFRQLCGGSADGFVTDRIILDRLLLQRPADCEGVRLSLTSVADASLELHVLAKPSWKPEADRLLSGIEALKRDGTVALIALRYPAVSSGSAGFLVSLLQAKHENDSLRRALSIAAVTLVIVGFALFWLLRQMMARHKTEMELRVVNRALEESNSDLQQFSYAASHDLSEPLRNMSIYSELLLRRYSDKLDDGGRQYVQVIRNGALRLEQLLDGLRRYSRLSRTDRPTSADAASVLTEVCASLQGQIEESGAVITSGQLPVVPMEPGWLMQVLQNLVSNAIKYRGSEPPRIHVWADHKDGAICVSVRDNGVGIKREYQERVFAVFKRLHGQDVPGTGIGLAICRKIIERQGGRIWVESNAAEPGSTFRFTIPVDGTRESMRRRIVQAVRR